MYHKFWFVLPVHEVALKSSSAGIAKVVNRDGLTNAKIAAMAILGLSALVCSVLPIGIAKFLRKGRPFGPKGLRTMDLLLRLGGGILLATTFIHLLPEVREGYDNLKDELNSWPDNFPELIMCVGFFMMYGIEELAHIFLHRHNGRDRTRSGTSTERRGSRRESRGSTHRHSHHHDAAEGGHSHVIAGGAPVRGLLIILALSIHQIFEGLAIGLEQDTSHVWILLAAVAAHKLVIAFCVGFEIASTDISFLTATACVAIFAIASPIGIATGIGVASESEPNSSIDVASVILQGFATGTLLFVVFFEVLTKTNDEHSAGSKTGLYHFLAAALGFLFMTCLLFAFTD